MFKKSFFIIFFFIFLNSLIPYLLNSSAYAYTETTFYIHQDNLGSVVAVTSDATTSGKIDYSSYGSSVGAGLRPAPWDRSSDLSLQQNNGIPTERAYTGQIQDASTSLSYYNARYYDPILSRFISADKMGGGNRYSYVSNNPISSSDPTGNMETADDRGGGGGKTTKPPPPFPSFNTPISSTSVPMGTWSSGYGATSPYSQSDIPIGAGCRIGQNCGNDSVFGVPIAMAMGDLFIGGTCALGFLPSCYAMDAAMGADVVARVTTGNKDQSWGQISLPTAMVFTGLGSFTQGMNVNNDMGGGEAQDMITIYKGMPAENIGQDIVPRAGRNFDMGGGIIKQAEDPAIVLARMQAQGMNREDIALAQANYSNQWSPALSWTTDMSVARDWAMKAACETGCGVIIQAQVLKSSGVFIPDLLMSGRLLNAPELTAKILAESEFTTFGIFPSSNYMPIWTIQAAP